MRINAFIVVQALVMALLLVAGAETARVAVGTNFHAVVKGRCYRCAQPGPDDVRLLARRLGIRGIVNMRGFDEKPWYYEERATAERLGVAFADAGIWAAWQPTEAEFLNVVRAVDECPEPMLIHCQSGSDRSGLAAATFLLLKTDSSVAEASRQLSLRFGHYPWGAAGCMDRLLAGYAAWLAEHDWAHRPDRFRVWANEAYHPEHSWGDARLR
jgi:protein tyrosine phosphatase (PTP) superfamily phosphohydrolase (DUF442 family)